MPGHVWFWLGMTTPLVFCATGCQQKASKSAASTPPSAQVASAKPHSSSTPDNMPDLLAIAPEGKPAEAPRAAPQFEPPPPSTPAAPIGVSTTRREIKIALEDIRIAIDNYSLASGKMPSPALTLEIVRQAAPKYAELIRNGSIVIHPALNREDVWAYEAQSDASTVYVLFADRVEEMDMTAFRRRMGR